MGIAAGQSYLLGPLVALVAVAALALLLRWAYGSRSAPPAALQPESADFGLLREVAELDSEEGANALRALLSDAGIRSTKARNRRGGVRVMVFAADLDRARQLAGPR
jgi:hypothetical protein